MPIDFERAWALLALATTSAGLPRIDVPPPHPGILDCLVRRRVRRSPGEVSGAQVWVARLGVTVLAHQPVTGGWACTVVGVDSATTRRTGQLPVGVAVLDELELLAATAAAPDVVDPLWAQAGSVDVTVDAEAFADAWRVRLADRRVPAGIVEALAETADPDRMVNLADPRLLRRSGCRAQRGFEVRTQQLIKAGALRSDPAEGAQCAVLTMPEPLWSP